MKKGRIIVLSILLIFMFLGCGLENKILWYDNQGTYINKDDGHIVLLVFKDVGDGLQLDMYDRIGDVLQNADSNYEGWNIYGDCVLDGNTLTVNVTDYVKVPINETIDDVDKLIFTIEFDKKDLILTSDDVSRKFKRCSSDEYDSFFGY